MSAEFPIRSGKRPGSPIEANNSFVKNVASRMSSYLPNTLRKWFGSPTSSNANGSAPVAESSASSSEDEDQPALPPAKRTRFTSVATVTNHIAPETKCASTSTDLTEPISVVHSPSLSIFKPESNFASTPIRSGGADKNFERDKDSPIYSQSSHIYEANKSIAKKRKSLFDVRNTEEVCKIPRKSSPVLDYSQPKFKPSLLGSPFNTRYSNTASTYLNRPNIKQKIDVVVSEPPKNDSVTLSNSTRRILDMLENYSSPLIEAKRISQCQRCVPDTLNKNSLQNSASANVSRNYQELYVPTYAKQLQLKRLRSKLNDSTSAARQIYASLSSSQPYPASKSLGDKTTEKSDKFTTKMKTNLTHINRNKVQSDTYRSEPVNFPTAGLQIDPNNLPKFTLGTSETESSKTSTMINPSETTANASTASAANCTTNESNSTNQLTQQELASVNKRGSIDSQIVYKFSSPLDVNAVIVPNSQILNYPFDSPERQLVKQSKAKDSSQSEIWKCDDCSVTEIDSEKCICCGVKKSSNRDVNMKKCSVCKASLSQENSDKCLDCTKKIDKLEQRGPQITQPSKWKCQDCWVSNDESVDKCVCCGGKKPQTVTSIANDKSNNVDSEWKCDICWIKNKKSAETCLACGGAKPVATESNTKVGSAPPSTSSIPTSTQALKKIVAAQSDKWECKYCLVRNDKNRSTCICCDAEKPDPARESQYKKFNFGQVPNTFKFTIDHNQNKSDNNSGSVPPAALSESTLKQLEANSDNVPKPATFTFGIPKQQTNATITEKETITEETPKSTFTFGLSKPVAAPSINKSTVDSLETDETVQEVPNVVGPSTRVPDNTTRPMGLFGIPLNTPATTAPAPITFGQEKITTALSVPAVTTTAEDTKTSQSTFNFSASGINPGLFSAVVSTPATTSVSFPTVQAPTTSSVSFFQKSEPVQTSSMRFFSKTDPVPSTSSLFNKNYTPATTEAPAPVSNVPVFSFGSNNPNAIQAEKPKFNFTFSKKTETSPSFTLPASNNGSIMSGNNLPSGSGLAASTPIGGNNIPLSLGLGFPSNDSSTIRMTPGNTIEQEQGINNVPAVPSSNPFSVQVTKENSWWPNQNTANTTSTANPANNAAAPSPMFGAQEKNENTMWSLNTNNSNSNMFVQNTAADGVQKPAAFSFASQNTSSMPFNSNNITPSTNFGSPAPMSSMFGMPRQDNNQPALFPSNLQTTQNNMFGAQASNNTAPSLGMFGTPNASSTLFGSSPSSVPTFEAAPSMPTVPAPTFNFGAQRTTGVFGFGQQQAPPQPGVYNFGAGLAGSPQRQFNIGTAGGSANAIGQRRIKRAVRRNTPR